MAITPFLAMTAAEMGNISAYPQKVAWMACHFSPYGLGLSNLPRALPPGALLMLDDITPPHGHDPVLIAEQLAECAETLQCRSVLLDFQRSGDKETRTLAEHLVQALPCPTIVSEYYAYDLPCPVFLSPVPPSVPLEAHLLPWKERKIWLELGLDGEILTLTEQGCEATPLPRPDRDAEGFSDDQLHCHYTVGTNENAARFTLWRTMEDLDHLLTEAETYGVTEAIGLFQELHSKFPETQKPLRISPERF